MKYSTINEFNHFDYNEAVIGDVERMDGFIHLWLDNVFIHPECSVNRDIRRMRCNNMCFKLQDMKILSFVEEGYRYYDANGKLMREDPDHEIDPADYAGRFEAFSEGYVVDFKKDQLGDRFLYTLVADSNDEHTYCVKMSAIRDFQEWDRFLSPAENDVRF